MRRIIPNNGIAEQDRVGVLAFEELSLYEPILRVLVYYDLFLYPLTSGEIASFIEVENVLTADVENGLALLHTDGKVGYHKGYWFLKQRGREVVERRLQMEERGKEMWKIARRVGWMMRMTPFVRGIFISGQLSRYIADEESDIDYFIVTEPGRLWIVRTLFVLIRRTLFLNSRKYFCTNYYVSADNLTIRERNIYTACEISALKPLWNHDLFRRMIGNNRWLKEFYPNFSFEDVEFRKGVSQKRSMMQWLLERLVPKRLAAKLDKRLMEITRKFWHHKFPDCPQRTYETALRCTPSESRAHPHDQSVTVLTRYRKALIQQGISSNDRTSDG